MTIGGTAIHTGVRVQLGGLPFTEDTTEPFSGIFMEILASTLQYGPRVPSPGSFNEVYDRLSREENLSQTYSHCRSPTQGLVDAAEVVVEDVERDRVSVILGAFLEKGWPARGTGHFPHSNSCRLSLLLIHEFSLIVIHHLKFMEASFYVN